MEDDRCASAALSSDGGVSHAAADVRDAGRQWGGGGRRRVEEDYRAPPFAQGLRQPAPALRVQQGGVTGQNSSEMCHKVDVILT